MPLDLIPDAGDPIETKPVAFSSWDITKEWFEIKTYLDDKVLRDARARATRSIKEPGGKVREELDNDEFMYLVLKAQVTDWHFYNRAGALVKFNDANLRKLRTAAKNFLFEQILACDGVIPTEHLVVVTDDGVPLDYKRQDARLGAGAVHEVPDPV